MKNILSFLLVLLMVPALLLADEFELRSFKKTPNDLFARRDERKDVNDQSCAVIKVLTDIQALKFTANLGIEGSVGYADGVYTVFISPGERRLQIYAEGFIPFVFNIPEVIEPLMVYEMVLTAIRTTPGQSGNKTGFVLIKSSPVGARVIINGQESGLNTPYQQMYNAGSHHYELRKEMYGTYQGDFTIKANETTTLNISLTPNFGSFALKTQPENGATVSIDGKLQTGTTPFNIGQLSPGSYSLVVQKDMYETIERDFLIRRGETTTLDLVMQPLFANVTVQTSPAAEIYINNQRMGNGTWRGRLPHGMQLLEARLDRYRSASRRLEVQAGKAETISLELQAITGTLAVMSTPPKAEIYMGGKNYGESPKIIPDLQIGNYEVTLKKAGYADASGQVLIKDGETTQFSLTLAAGMQVSITSSPTGANLYINGSPTGKTPYSGELAFGNHLLKLVNKTKTVEENISITQGGRSSFNFNVAETRDITETTSALNLEMVYVPGGAFTMGCTGKQASDCYGDEKTTHQITVSNFYMGKYEVTQAHWIAIMGSNPSRFKDCNNCPVENVSWNDVQEFIKKLNQKSGKTYRLPTEAEWEYAARGGASAAKATTTTSVASTGSATVAKYAGSNNIDEVAWYENNSGNKTRPVGQNKVNALGIFDLSGNVWEWCNDWYGSYSSNSQINFQGPGSGSNRVLRGGSWLSNSKYCRVSFRCHYNPGNRGSDSGFRLVSSP